MIVVDASVAVKWFVHEVSSRQADDVLARHSGALIAPDFFAIEVSAAFVRKANMDKSNRSGAEASLSRLFALFESNAVRLERTSPAQLAAAARLALDLGHPLKDCIYLALAMEMRCDLVTGDARFAAKAQPVWPGARVLEG
jgi:predicted nucleic acid-binding protein